MNKFFVVEKIQIYRNISTLPPYTTVPYKHMRTCNAEKQKGKQKVPIGKKTTGYINPLWAFRRRRLKCVQVGKDFTPFFRKFIFLIAKVHSLSYSENSVTVFPGFFGMTSLLE